MLCIGVVVEQQVGGWVSVNRGLYLWFLWLRVVGVRVGSLMEVRRVKNRGIGGRKE